MKTKFRSQQWFWGPNETGLLHQGALRAGGINMDTYTGQPIIGIANTWSQLNNCNMSLKTVAEHVKKGVLEAGGIPLEFPVISLGEELMKPSAMLYRNLLSIDVEENLRAYPIDGVILLGNCDKTVPGLLMGAVSANFPTIQLNAGPKKVGVFKGQRLGSGTDLWKYWDELRVGNISEMEWQEIGKALSCGMGACNTMGTASTMNGVLEALGIMPLGSSTMAVDSEERAKINFDAGKRIVHMVYEDLKPSDILTKSAFENAIKLLLAIGGSTNAVIHLTAIAGRLNLKLFPEKFNLFGAQIPCLVDVQPSGKKLIDEFHQAGGMPGVLSQMKSILDLSVITYTGKKLKELLDVNLKIDQNIIRTMSNPITAAPSLAVLNGNLAPNGAIIKVAAASSDLLCHTGLAVVFENYEDMLARIDDPNLDVDANSVLVLKNAGPKGVPGMPEWGMIPIPTKLQKIGVKDMVRISDSRMSGTSFGTVVLHVCPEAFEGGTIALVVTGDSITLDIHNRNLQLNISETELSNRKLAWKKPEIKHKRGYPSLYIREVLQANEGCDFDFLRPKNEQDCIFIEPIVGRS